MLSLKRVYASRMKEEKVVNPPKKPTDIITLIYSCVPHLAKSTYAKAKKIHPNMFTIEVPKR